MPDQIGRKEDKEWAEPRDLWASQKVSERTVYWSMRSPPSTAALWGGSKHGCPPGRERCRTPRSVRPRATNPVGGWYGCPEGTRSGSYYKSGVNFSEVKGDTKSGQCSFTQEFSLICLALALERRFVAIGQWLVLQMGHGFLTRHTFVRWL